MAIYHFNVKLVQRTRGENAVAGAAYRSASLLHEQSTGVTHDYTRKYGVEHHEILAPNGVPSWVFDCHTLWNTLEGAERRKDAHAAREVEVGLPIELLKCEPLALIRDNVNREFVAKGMVADLGTHRDNPRNPHAHVLLTTRRVTLDGLGPNARDWNAKSKLLRWRRGWAEVTNEHLIEAGLGVRIDHRSYKEQPLDLIPGRKIGVSHSRQQTLDLPSFLQERVAEQQRIAGANGQQIITEPAIALKALSHGNATFSHHDVAKFLHTRTDSGTPPMSHSPGTARLRSSFTSPAISAAAPTTRLPIRSKRESPRPWPANAPKSARMTTLQATPSQTPRWSKPWSHASERDPRPATHPGHSNVCTNSVPRPRG